MFFIPFIVGASAYAVHEFWTQGLKKQFVRPKAVPRSSPVAKLQGPPSTAAKIVGWLEPKSQAEAEILRELKMSTTGLSLAIAGLFYYPLQLGAVVFLAPSLMYTSKAAYRNLVHEHRITSDLLTVVLAAGALAGGFFVAMTVGVQFYVVVRWLAAKTEAHSQESIVNLFGQQERSAWILVQGVEVEVPLERIHAGDVIVVHGGQTIPTDGVVTDGQATVDQHMLTGEAQPVEKGVGDEVLASTLVRAGRISIRVERAGQDTTAAQITRMLTDTSDFTAGLRSRATEFNDRLAAPMILFGAVSYPFVGLSSALAIIAATPGYRMALFGPVGMLSYLHLAAESAILIKDGRSLESLHDVDTVIFDKTGTLTTAELRVAKVIACEGFGSDEVLAFAAAAEARQHHPIATAILNAAAQLGVEVEPADESTLQTGFGIAATVNGLKIDVGSFRYMDVHGIQIPETIRVPEREANEVGHSLVLVAVEGVLAGGIVLEPTIRPEAAAIVKQLRSRGIKMYVMSGDREAPTRHLSRQLKMDGYFAQVLPADKANLVQELQAKGRRVCFIGDGINDSIALKSANVSVSLSGATTIAVDIAQIVLIDGTLTHVPYLFELADGFRDNMRFSYLAAMVPSFVIIGGAVFFGLGLLPSVLIYQVSVPFALYNTLRPLMRRRETGDAGGVAAVRPKGLLTAGDSDAADSAAAA